VKDTAFVYTPPTLDTLDEDGNLGFTFGCVDNNCFNEIKFSCHLPPIRLESSVWAKVASAGDLNHDGIDELLVGRAWFIGSYSSLYLYSYIDHLWQVLARVDYSVDDEDLKKHILKIGGNYYLEGFNLQVDDPDWRPYKKQIRFK
jgi:hypothetical protein